MSTHLISIMTFDHEHSALAAKAKLEALGIDAHIINGGSTSSSTSLDDPLLEGYNLCVKEGDEIVAREILEETMNDSDMFHNNDI